MNQMLIDPAVRTGCDDVSALKEVLEAAVQRQRSPIDDVLDYAYSTVNELHVLKVMPTSFMERIASLLRDAGYELLLAVQRLKEHPAVAIDHAQRAKALENRVEQVYRDAIADLFSGPEDVHHIVEMLKSREVYRHLSNAADRGDEAANVISDIVVKTS